MAEPPPIEDRIALAKERAGIPAAEDPPETEATETETEESSDEETEQTEGAGNGEGEDTESEAGDEGETEQEEEAGDGESPLAALDDDARGSVLSLLKDKGIAALAEALGEDPKPYQKLEGRFAAISRREKKVKDNLSAIEEAKKTLTKDSGQLVQDRRQFWQEKQFVIGGRKAWDDGDMTTTAKSLERWLGASISEITQRLAEGDRELSPTERRLKEENDRLRAQQQPQKPADKKPDEPAKPDRDQAEKRAIGRQRMLSALERHPYIAGDDDAADEVFSAWEASWDGEKFTKTPKQVADELQAKAVKRAERLGLKRPAATTSKSPPKKKPKPKVDEPPPTPRKDGKAPSVPSREQRIAWAKQMTERNQRMARGG